MVKTDILVKVRDYYLILQKLLKQKIEDFFITMGTEKGFHSLNHIFLISAFENMAFV